MQLLRDRRFVLTILVTLVVAGFFWAGSRVPALNEKATMGSETQVTSLGFETMIASSVNDPVWKRIGIEAINWAQTNRKGMTFGVIFGGLMMTVFGLLGRRQYRSAYANSAIGTLIGAPLGVCVNCAAPIAAGMASAGARIETALSAMMSSPTLNIIVLTMLFALVPLHLAVLKLALTLITVMVVVPILVRRVFRREVLTRDQEMDAKESCELPFPNASAPTSWFGAAKWVVVNGSRNLWHVLIRTVPLMLLAGLLGAVMITLLPWDTLAHPFESRNLLVVLSAIGIISVVGTFLPVPMAFDVIVAAVLLGSGMPARYVGVLLFTLGIFSIYSYFIVWKTISPRVAHTLYGAVAALGVVAGVGAHFLTKAVTVYEAGMVDRAINARLRNPEPRLEPLDVSFVSPVSAFAAPVPTPMVSVESPGLTVSRYEFAPVSGDGSSEDRLFTAAEGASIGIDRFGRMHFMKMMQPWLHHGMSISSGDVDNNGLDDLLIVHDGQLLLYANRGGRFEARSFSLGPLDGALLLSAAFVDVNGDGWLDVYVASHTKGAWLYRNLSGAFGPPSRLPTGDNALMPAVMTYGDVDHNGTLDLVIGRWESAVPGIRATRRSTPVMLLNRGADFEIREIDVPSGQPNSVLLTDFNGDKHLDLVVTYDFRTSDYFLAGDGNGGFSQIPRSRGVIPATVQNPMSIASVDVNNDLRLDLFIPGVANYGDHDARHPLKEIAALCNELTDKERRNSCRSDMAHHGAFSAATSKDMLSCRSIDNRQRREECVLFVSIFRRDAFSRAQLCDRFPSSWESTRQVCNAFRTRPAPHTPDDHPEDVPQLHQSNVFLLATADRRFVERGKEMGLDKAGWAWSSKFADLDLDGWLDLYVATGWFGSRKRQESSYFYRNLGGERFEEVADSVGLRTFFPATTYSYIDVDADGDLDIVMVPTYGPVIFFRNNSRERRALQIQLRDSSQNRDAIGARVTITLDDDTRSQQMRELQGGGGYLSFDAPIAHFGLGSARAVARVDIVWPDGAKSAIRGALSAGYRYVISREALGSSPLERAATTSALGGLPSVPPAFQKRQTP